MAQGSITETRPKLSHKVRLKPDPITGKMALLYPEGVLLLNPTGYAIVQLCDSERTIAQIADVLATAYNQTAEVLQGEVIKYVRRLESIGLMEIASE